MSGVCGGLITSGLSNQISLFLRHICNAARLVPFRTLNSKVISGRRHLCWYCTSSTGILHDLSLEMADTGAAAIAILATVGDDRSGK